MDRHERRRSALPHPPIRTKRSPGAYPHLFVFARPGVRRKRDVARRNRRELELAAAPQPVQRRDQRCRCRPTLGRSAVAGHRGVLDASPYHRRPGCAAVRTSGSYRSRRKLPGTAITDGQEAILQARHLGNAVVGAIGMGTALLAFDMGPLSQDRFFAAVRAALDAGITLIDTADAYAPSPGAMGYAEEMVSAAVSSMARSEDILVATKFGHRRGPDGEWPLDGRPEYVRKACDRSLRALGVERIGLYQYHRPDPAVPYAETIGAVQELRKIGKVNMVGISNANLEQIATAEAVLGEGGLASVQNEYSPRFRSSEGELRYCARRGIAFLAYSPLGGSDYSAQIPARRPAFADIAARRGVSSQRVCLAWLLSLAPNVIPLTGATRSTTIRDSAASADLQLDADELAQLQAPPRGEGERGR